MNSTTYTAQGRLCSLTNISDEVLWPLSDVNKVLRVVVVGVSALRAFQEDVGVLVRGFRLSLSQNPSHFLAGLVNKILSVKLHFGEIQ